MGAYLGAVAEEMLALNHDLFAALESFGDLDPAVEAAAQDDGPTTGDTGFTVVDEDRRPSLVAGSRIQDERAR